MKIVFLAANSWFFVFVEQVASHVPNYDSASATSSCWTDVSQASLTVRTILSTTLLIPSSITSDFNFLTVDLIKCVQRLGQEPIKAIYLGAYVPPRENVHYVMQPRIVGPNREKTCHLTCALNEDSNQPARMRRLICVFLERIKKLWFLGYPKRALNDNLVIPYLISQLNRILF